MKIKHPINKIDRIKDIKYRAIVQLKNGKSIDFSFTEMQQISDMFESFKQQTGFKSI